jgi:hypothetical protein
VRPAVAAQGCTGLGRIALPGQGIGNVELGHVQQGLRFGAHSAATASWPLAAGFVDFFSNQLGGAFVFDTQLLEDVGQLLRHRGWSAATREHARTRSPEVGAVESATGQTV